MKKIVFLLSAGILFCNVNAQSPANGKALVGFSNTHSGMKYKIFEGGDKNTTQLGSVLKMHLQQHVSGSVDTLLLDTHNKLPVYIPIQTPDTLANNKYGPEEIFQKLKKGDSLIAIMSVDSLLAKGLATEDQLPPFLKRGNMIHLNFKVLEVFKTDSLARLDYEREMERDAPRQKKEQEEMMKKQMAEFKKQQDADDAALEKSGEKTKQIQAVESYLKTKGINAIKTPTGVFVKLDNPGSGAQVTDGKFVTATLVGKKFQSDSIFQPQIPYTVQIGQGQSIRGLEDGLKAFKQGGKGVVYIPGFLAYGKTPPPGSPFSEYEPLYFMVEITSISDKEPEADLPQSAPQENTQE